MILAPSSVHLKDSSSKWLSVWYLSQNSRGKKKKGNQKQWEEETVSCQPPLFKQRTSGTITEKETDPICVTLTPEEAAITVSGSTVGSGGNRRSLITAMRRRGWKWSPANRRTPSADKQTTLTPPHPRLLVLKLSAKVLAPYTQPLIPRPTPHEETEQLPI